MITEHKVHFQTGSRSRKQLRPGAAASAPIGRIPRISKFMALAIRFDDLIRTGQVRDQAELARLGHVSRARLTQIMNLLLLAPDIQEEVLFLPGIEHGREQIQLRQMQTIAKRMAWGGQRKNWRALMT